MIYIFRKIMIRCVIIISIFLMFKTNVYATDILPNAGFHNFINEIDTSIEAPKRQNYLIIGHSGKKTFMGYTTITDKTSKQYTLQEKAYTDELGFRKIGDRYCVAIGTAFNANVGQYFNAELENGTIIKCIVGEIKDDKDTDINNVFTKNGCCLEFIVDTKILDPSVKFSGDCSSLCDEWDSLCLQFIIYELNILQKGEE